MKYGCMIATVIADIMLRVAQPPGSRPRSVVFREHGVAEPGLTESVAGVEHVFCSPMLVDPGIGHHERIPSLWGSLEAGQSIEPLPANAVGRFRVAHAIGLGLVG